MKRQIGYFLVSYFSYLLLLLRISIALPGDTGVRLDLLGYAGPSVICNNHTVTGYCWPFASSLEQRCSVKPDCARKCDSIPTCTGFIFDSSRQICLFVNNSCFANDNTTKSSSNPLNFYRRLGANERKGWSTTFSYPRVKNFILRAGNCPGYEILLCSGERCYDVFTCSDRCLENARCKGFTFDFKLRVCRLKSYSCADNSLVNTKPDVRFYSRAKINFHTVVNDVAIYPKVYGYAATNGNCPDNLVHYCEGGSCGSVDLCAKLCNDTGTYCKGFSFDFKDRTCRTKSYSCSDYEILSSNRYIFYRKVFQSITLRWSEWGSWSRCSVSCGRGQQVRRRMCEKLLPSVAKQGCVGNSFSARGCYRNLCATSVPSTTTPGLPSKPAVTSSTVSGIPQVTGFKYANGLNCPGFILRHCPSQKCHDVRVCGALCVKDMRCRGFTYNFKEDGCFLKRYSCTETQLVIRNPKYRFYRRILYDTDNVFEPKEDPLYPEVLGYRLHSGNCMDFVLDYCPEHTCYSPHLCSNECNALKACAGFSYNFGSGGCYLKSAPCKPSSLRKDNLIYRFYSRHIGCTGQVPGDYRGGASVTESGKLCIRWDNPSILPYAVNPTVGGEIIRELQQRDGTSHHNFCRNPLTVNDTAPWCYHAGALTHSYRSRWEYCSVPSCMPPALISVISATDDSTEPISTTTPKNADSSVTFVTKVPSTTPSHIISPSLTYNFANSQTASSNIATSSNAAVTSPTPAFLYSIPEIPGYRVKSGNCKGHRLYFCPVEMCNNALSCSYSCTKRPHCLGFTWNFAATLCFLKYKSCEGRDVSVSRWSRFFQKMSNVSLPLPLDESLSNFHYPILPGYSLRSGFCSGYVILRCRDPTKCGTPVLCKDLCNRSLKCRGFSFRTTDLACDLQGASCSDAQIIKNFKTRSYTKHTVSQYGCGIPAIEPDLRQPRIIGGRPAIPNSWPWTVIIELNGGPACAGVIIDPSWIVSAGHCFNEATVANARSKVRVIAGRVSRDFEEPHQQIATVRNIIVHPNFVQRTFENDIALIQLTFPLSYNAYVSPVCLAAQSFASNASCWVTGWGITDNTSPEGILSQLMLPIVTGHHCNKLGVSPNMFCAGYLEGGRDACLGDSGAPLVCKRGQRWEHFGIVSWGYDCAEPNYPGIYTRVPLFNEWIHRTIATNYQPAQDDAYDEE